MKKADSDQRLECTATKQKTEQERYLSLLKPIKNRSVFGSQIEEKNYLKNRLNSK